MAQRKPLIRARLEEAAVNYIKVNGPASSIAIAESGMLNSGKLLKNTRFGLTPTQVSQMLAQNPRFQKTLTQKRTRGHRTMSVWKLRD